MINEIKTAIEALRAHANEDFVSRKEAEGAANGLEQLLSQTKDAELESIYEEIKEEVLRAEHKHPNWPIDKLYAASIVAEESGELTRAAVQYEMNESSGNIYDVRKEAIQTAATCVRLIKNL